MSVRAGLGAAAVCIGLFARPGIAWAQQYVVSANGAVASGVEGGGAGAPSPQLARTRIRLGAELHIDEFPKDVLGIGLMVDFGTHSSFGADMRYVRPLGEKWKLNVGAIVFIAPATLIGPSAGFAYRIHLTSGTALTVGPEANVFVLGSDLPGGTILWQGLLQVGIDADL